VILITGIFSERAAAVPKQMRARLKIEQVSFLYTGWKNMKIKMEDKK